MEDLVGFATTAGAVIVSITLIAGALALLLVLLRKSTTQIVRDENNDLRLRVETLEKKLGDAEDENIRLKADLEDLKELVTSAGSIGDLAVKVAHYHDEVSTGLLEVRKLLNDRRVK